MKKSLYCLLAFLMVATPCKAEGNSTLKKTTKAAAHTAAAIVSLYLAQQTSKYLDCSNCLDVFRAEWGRKSRDRNLDGDTISTLAYVNLLATSAYISYKNSIAAYTLFKDIFKKNTQASAKKDTTHSKKKIQ